MRTMPCATVLAAVAVLAVVLGCAVPASAAGAETLGCGGFVRLSDAFRARGTADLSTVRVQLLRGSVAKFATECSPAGYFFLPAYEPGDYTVVVDTAAGFVFDTPAQPVTLAPGADAAALVFTVTGFTVAGAFVPPVAVPVALLDAATGAAVATATADAATGAFAFAGVLPGAYVAAVAHDGWTFAARTQHVDATGRVPATLRLAAPFTVTGYAVRGAVAPTDGKSAPELVLALYRAGANANEENTERRANDDENAKAKANANANANAGDANEKAAAVPRCGAGALGRADIAGLAETEAAQGLRAADFVCAVRSRADASGAFVLENVAPGAYVLVPHRAAADGTAYDIAPARAALTVAADAVALRERFRVVGLSVAGTVLAPNGSPLAGVALTAHARGTRAPVATAVSDAAGRYRLPGVRAGAVLTVAARAPDDAFVFAPLRDVTVAPGAAAVLPPLRALGTLVRGQVVLRASSGNSNSNSNNKNALTYPCTLAVADAATGAAVSTVITGRTGDFATHLPDGTYTLRVVRADRGGDSSAAAAPVPGAPAPVRVAVASAPVAGVVLRQETHTYRGTVRFLQACPAGFRVHLTPRAGGAAAAAAGETEARAAPVVPADGRADATVGTFVFEDVLAGDYELSVVAPPESKSKSKKDSNTATRGPMCFAQESYNVTVARAAAPPTVVFAQMGYRLTLVAPVAVEDVALTCAADPGLLMHQPLRAGVPLTLCVSTPGRWLAEPRDALARFDRAQYEVYAAATPSPVSRATLTPAAYRVRGTVHLAQALPAALLPRVRVQATVANTTTTTTTKTGSSSKNSNSKKAAKERALEVDTEIADDNERALDYAAWLRVGERAVFSFSGPDGVVFYPPQRTATMRRASDAAARLAPVAARPEVVLRGRVDPPTPHVQVTVVAQAATAAEGKEGAEETVVARTETDAEGRYVVRGLRDDVAHRELFARPGLAFEVARERARADDELVVAAVRLAALTVAVRDAADGAPLAGVLVAVSGGPPDAPYHAHAVTAADGTLTTGELAPGEYYARPLLKEYAFAPATAAVAVARGSAPVVEFSGTRHAYSVFGRVARLDQHAATGVSVVAVPVPVPDGSADSASAAAAAAAAVTEQAQTDETGAYRIRGLVPGVRYTVRLESEGGAATENNNSTEKNSTATATATSTAIPAVRTVVMGAADVRGQDFVAVPLARGAASQVLGRVAARDAGALAHMEAVLSCNGSALQVVPLARLPVFGFAGLRAGTYDVALRQTVVPSKKQPASTVRCTAQPAHAAVTVAHAALAEVRFTVSCAEDAREGGAGVGGAAHAHRATSVWTLVALAVAGAMLVRRERVMAVAFDVFARAEQWIAAHRGGKQQQQRRSGRKQLQQSRSAFAKPMTAEDRAASFLPEHLQKKKK